MKKLIKTHKHEDFLVIELLIDRFNIFDKMQLSEQVEKALRKNKYPHVIFNLNNVTYIDSIGIGFFISTQNIFNENDRKMMLVCPHRLLEIFDTVNMHRFCGLYNSVDQAFIEMEKIVSMEKKSENE